MAFDIGRTLRMPSASEGVDSLFGSTRSPESSMRVATTRVVEGAHQVNALLSRES
jgi:hypothetical protein